MRKISITKIPFGLRNGKLLGVSEVKSGLACDCVCVSCGRNLQANKGDKVSHYFSHDPSAETMACESAFETSIHWMAKQILSEDGCSIFPGLTLSVSKSDSAGVTHKAEIQIEKEIEKHFESVELEKRVEEIRPDIIVYINGNPFLIEIAVTSFVDRKKKNIIRNLGLPAIEIDLSSVNYTTTKDELKKLINASSTKKKWLSNPNAIDAKKKLIAKLDEQIKLINEKLYILYNNKSKPLKPEIRDIRPVYKMPHVMKDYDPRWFSCEACRYLFEVPLLKAPYTIETISCPECAHAVSAKRYRG